MTYNTRRLLDDLQQTQTTATPNTTSADAAEAAAANPVQFDSSSVAVTALVLFSALLFLGFFSVYARRLFTNEYDNHHDISSHRRAATARRGTGGYFSSVPRGLDPITIRTLPQLSYPGGEKAGSPGCVVCLSEFEDGETVKVIPGCGHLFHPQCIDLWLVAHASCPLCRSTQLFGMSSKLGEACSGVERGGGGGGHVVGEEGEMVEVVVAGGGREEVEEEEEVVVRERDGLVVEEREGGGGPGGGGMRRSKSCGCLVMEKMSSLPRRSCSL